MADGGKGSRHRPIEDQDQFDKNWDRIFGGVSSPCVDICALDYVNKLCIGCGRTLDDIRRWQAWPDAERQSCLSRAQSRMTAMGRPWPPVHPKRPAGR